MKQRWREIAQGWTEELRSVLNLLPLFVGATLIAMLATRAGPAATECHFQSPVMPSPVMPQETVVGPTPTVAVLKAVLVPPNLTPWIVGLLVVIIVVGGILYWRSRREGSEGSE